MSSSIQEECCNETARASWFVDYRLSWIKEMVEIFGFINRYHVVKKFHISEAQASLDLRSTRARWPDLMMYDLSKKTYKLLDRATNQPIEFV